MRNRKSEYRAIKEYKEILSAICNGTTYCMIAVIISICEQRTMGKTCQQVQGKCA